MYCAKSQPRRRRVSSVVDVAGRCVAVAVTPNGHARAPNNIRDSEDVHVDSVMRCGTAFPVCRLNADLVSRLRCNDTGKYSINRAIITNFSGHVGHCDNIFS